MALDPATEKMDGGVIKDPEQRMVVKSVAGGSPLDPTDYIFGGLARDADGRVLVVDQAAAPEVDVFDQFEFDKRSGVIRETIPRGLVTGNTSMAGGSGVWILSAIALKAGDVITGVRVPNQSATSGLTQSYAGLFSYVKGAGPANGTLTLRAVSPSNTGAWAGNTERTFNFGSSYEVPEDGLYYIGVCVVATTTMPNFWGAARGSVAALIGEQAFFGLAGAGLTTPPAVGTTYAGFTASGSQRHYFEALGS